MSTKQQQKAQTRRKPATSKQPGAPGKRSRGRPPKKVRDPNTETATKVIDSIVSGIHTLGDELPDLRAVRLGWLNQRQSDSDAPELKQACNALLKALIGPVRSVLEDDGNSRSSEEFRGAVQQSIQGMVFVHDIRFKDLYRDYGRFDLNGTTTHGRSNIRISSRDNRDQYLAEIGRIIARLPGLVYIKMLGESPNFIFYGIMDDYIHPLPPYVGNNIERFNLNVHLHGHYKTPDAVKTWPFVRVIDTALTAAARARIAAHLEAEAQSRDAATPSQELWRHSLQASAIQLGRQTRLADGLDHAVPCIRWLAERTNGDVTTATAIETYRGWSRRERYSIVNRPSWTTVLPQAGLRKIIADFTARAVDGTPIHDQRDENQFCDSWFTPRELDRMRDRLKQDLLGNNGRLDDRGTRILHNFDYVFGTNRPAGPSVVRRTGSTPAVSKFIEPTSRAINPRK